MSFDVLNVVSSSIWSNTTLWTAFVIIAAITWRWWRKPHSKFPPGPRGIPILGVLPSIGSTFPEVAFKKWSLEKYGPIMSARLGSEDVVVLNTYETINKLFVEQASIFSGRPCIFIFQQLTKHHGFGMKDYDETFKVLKPFALQTLKNLGMGRKAMEVIINDEAQYFIEYLKDKMGKPVDLTMDFYNLIANIVSRVTLGRRFEFEDTNKELFDHIHQQFANEDDMNKIKKIFLFAFLRFIPPFYGVNKRFVDHNVKVLDELRTIIAEHKATFDPKDNRDYIDSFLSEQLKEKTKEKKFFTDKELEVTVRDLFAAGIVTTSSGMMWLVLLAMHYPEHHKKMLAEIDDVLGSAAFPSMANKVEMPFTCAFIQETFRAKTISPLAFQHRTTKDAHINGYKIPKGTTVVPNLWGTHNDPETWPNPEKFDPYRHIDKDGKFVYSKKIIPFSIGPRFCLGEGMARMDMFLLFVKFLQKFDFKPATGKPPPLDDAFNTIVYSPRRYEIILNER